MFPLEFPVGNTSLVVYVLSHLERIPAPAGAARAKSSTILGYTSYLKKNEEWAIAHKRIVLSNFLSEYSILILSNFLSEYLLEYSSLSTIVLSTLSTLNARARTFSHTY